MAGAPKRPGRAWLKRQSRSGRRQRTRIVLLGVAGAAGAVVQAWCIAQILGPALGGVADGVAGWAVLFAALALGRCGLAFLADGLAFEAGAAARRRVRHAVLGGLFAAGPVAVARRAPGELGAMAFDQVEALDGFFARWLPASTVALAAPALVLAAVLLADPAAAVVLLLAGLLVPVGMAAAGLGAAAASSRQFTAMGRLQARFLDRVRGLATLVLSGQAEAEALRLRNAAEELSRRTMRVLRVAFLSSAALDCAAAAALVLLAWRYAGQWRDGSLAQPEVAVFTLVLVAEFFAPLRAYAAAYQDRLHAAGAADSLATAATEVAQAQPAATPVRTVAASGVSLAFEDVGFTWDPARGPVLERLSFRVPAGETAILVGPSGAGKSTVIELLLGFVRPDSGRITLNGADLTSITPQALSRMTAWIGQRPVLFAGTVRDNIRFGRDDAGDVEVEDAARAAGIMSFAATLPEGLDTMVGEGGYGLSGGQAQRVAIARAIIRDAPLLLLDEPTAHLDPATESDVLDSLKRLALGRTVVLASHSSAAASFSGRRIVLDGGPVAQEKGAA